MTATLQARALHVDSSQMNFLEALSWLVQDELDRRRSRLQVRRYAHSGLTERKQIKEIDWTYKPKLPKRDIFELGTLKFIDAKEDVLLLGKPGTGKSHVAKALALHAVDRGYKVIYREAHICSNSTARAGGSRKPRSALPRAPQPRQYPPVPSHPRWSSLTWPQVEQFQVAAGAPARQ